MKSHNMSDSDDSDREYVPLHRRLAVSDGSAGSSFVDPIKLDSSDDDSGGRAPQPTVPSGPEAARSASPRGGDPGSSPVPPAGAEPGRRRGRRRPAGSSRTQLEKELRRAEAAARRLERPEHCQKAVHVLVDQRVLEVTGGGQLLAALQATTDATVHVTSAAQPGAITWRREVTDCTERHGQVVTTSRQEPQDQLVLVMEPQALASLVDQQGTAPAAGLAGAMMDLGNASGMKVTVLCWGLDSLCRTKTLAGSYRGTAGGARRRPGRLDRLQLEAAVVDILLDTPHSLRLVSSPTDGGVFLAQMSKAIAEAPFKRQRGQQQFSWFADVDGARPVKVDRQLRGLRRLWTEQLRQLSAGSLEAAQAVSAVYPSPQALLQAYAACDSPGQRERLVADLAVRRSVGPLVSSRRVGNEMSRKLYLAMTATDGSTEL